MEQASKKILIVDDNREIIETLQERLEMSGFRVSAAANWEQTRDALEAFAPHAVILDVYLDQDENGLDILARLRQTRDRESLPVLILTGQPEAALCLQALRDGANDFITKPVMDMDGLVEKLRQWTASDPGIPAATAPVSPKMVGRSKVLIDATIALFEAARLELDTLLIGETGTGKDLAATLFHQSSARAGQPFVVIDCTTIPGELFESEVFGYEKGAFSQAWNAHGGKVETAGNGILFFNEIGDLPLSQQKKLLRFWESKTFSRLGSVQIQKSNALILAATNRDLNKMVEEGQFRRDLYHRLMQRVIVLPPLRERQEDIPLLCDYFIEQAAYKYRKPIARLDEELLGKLVDAPWDGNVRQLRYVIFEGVCKTVGPVIKSLPSFSPSADSDREGEKESAAPLVDRSYREARDQSRIDFHREYLIHHLEQNNWQVTKTAATIGIPREQLTQLMKKYNLKRPGSA